jgi:hypothetical protein
MSHAWVKKDNNQLQQSRRRLGFQMDAIMGGGVALLISLLLVLVCAVVGWKVTRRRW